MKDQRCMLEGKRDRVSESACKDVNTLDPLSPERREVNMVVR